MSWSCCWSAARMASTRLAIEKLSSRNSRAWRSRRVQAYDRLAVSRVDEPIADRALERERFTCTREATAVALEIGDLAAQAVDPRLRRGEVLAQRPPRSQPRVAVREREHERHRNDTDRKPHAHRGPPHPGLGAQT